MVCCYEHTDAGVVSDGVRMPAYGGDSLPTNT